MAKGSRTRPASKPAPGTNLRRNGGRASRTRGNEAADGIPSGRTGRGTTFSEFQALIRSKYHATDAARGVPGTFMWFMEEIGELATALQDNAPGKSPTPAQRANLEEEFADVLAWLMTLANIAGADGRGIDIERSLRKYTQPGRVEGVKD